MRSGPFDKLRTGPVPQVAPCIVSHNLALGGAQTAILRMIRALPDWVRERTTLYCQSDDMPLLEAAIQKHGFSVGSITNQPPDDPSCWVLSYGKIHDLPARPTSLILHSWDEEGWRYVSKTYGGMKGLTVAGVSDQVLGRYRKWIEEGEHRIAGILPPPVTEWTICRGQRDPNRLVVVWMGRPLESKGLLSLPYLLAMDERLVVRAWTGADTAGLPYTRKIQAQTMEKFLALARKLGVSDRLDLRPLDFDPFAYRHRLEGAHVLLGNSRREGFLMTAAEALSCGLPVVVTRQCGVAAFVREGVNGCLIDWDDDPQQLAKASYRGILWAAGLDSIACLSSVQDLSLEARYREVYGQTLAELTHTSLQHAQPRVTVGVRIHKGMPIESLDQAISSLALQTYRQFKTVLLVDGPCDYAEGLAARYNLPLICTGQEPDITHCSGLHRLAVERCDTEFYKPLDYDDQLLPEYLERAVAAMDRRQLDVYGCLLMTLQNAQFSPRWWPNKPLEGMFTGNSGDNQLPHSSVLLRTRKLREAGNYAERAVGLGADDYNTWYRIRKAGGKFFRDDEVRNVVYRIHEKNSLPIRKQRYGSAQPSGPSRGALIAGATAASVALLVGPALNSAAGATQPPATEAGQHATSDASSASQAEQAALRDLVPVRNAGFRQIVSAGFESANTVLKQKLKSAFGKMWQSGK
ncbi:MAG TPA: glycosyltransferase, partial [Tepidisphaeraceae bacterium]|nr:glycosyltransferase [Tepidisphaeraceae bacterium]